MIGTTISGKPFGIRSGGPMPVLQSWKNRLARKMILRAYSKASAQACGQVVKRPVRSPAGLTPEELVSVITDDLARLEGEPQAAELLGLRAEEIAARRDHARQANDRIIRRHGGWFPPTQE